MAIGSDSPIHALPLPLVDSFLDLPVVEQRSRPVPLSVKLQDSQRKWYLQDSVSSAQRLARGGSRKRNRMENDAALYRHTSPLDIHPCDLEPGYEMPRETSPFTIAATLPDITFPETMNDLYDTNESCDVFKIGHLNLRCGDRGLKTHIRKCGYGYQEMLEVENSLLKHLNSNSQTDFSFTMEDSVLRLLLHSLCRYYGFRSKSKASLNSTSGETSEEGTRITKVHLDARRDTPLPYITFCAYFYGILDS